MGLNIITTIIIIIAIIGALILNQPVLAGLMGLAALLYALTALGKDVKNEFKKKTKEKKSVKEKDYGYPKWKDAKNILEKSANTMSKVGKEFLKEKKR